MTDLRERFWGPGGDRDRDDLARRVVVDGEHYLICDETASAVMRGFGGHPFGIEFFDGRRVTTRNLWHQGTVPPQYRDRYPDNARFVPASQVEIPTGGESR
jgi:hypothetical protein